MTIPPLPDPLPSRYGQTQSAFNSAMEAFFSWLPVALPAIQSLPSVVTKQSVMDALSSASPGAGSPISTLDAIATQGANIASGATVNLNAATGQLVTITGTATTTAVTLTNGRTRALRAAAAWPIQSGANLVVNGVSGGATFVCAPGDRLLASAMGGVVYLDVVGGPSVAYVGGSPAFAQLGVAGLLTGARFRTGTVAMPDNSVFTIPIPGSCMVLVTTLGGGTTSGNSPTFLVKAAPVDTAPGLIASNSNGPIILDEELVTGVGTSIAISCRNAGLQMRNRVGSMRTFSWLILD